MTSNETKVATDRAGMALIGALAGLAAWVLVELIPDMVSNPHLLIVISAGVVGYFSVLLAISGPVEMRKALLGAAYLAVPAALLLGWASLSFETTDSFLNGGFSPLAWMVLLFLGTPFIAVLMWDRRYWNSYLDLFDVSWSIVVRYAAAWLFVAVFWAVLFLSDALLSLVSITIIEDLIDQDPVPQVLTGAVLGLALRVVYEMRDYLSPYLLLRLLRLLLPVFLVVVSIFVVALPFSDPAKLFGGLSPAATLMSVALGGVGLISVTLEKSDADATQSAFMLLVTKAMAILLPVLAGLACYGIYLRVAQYGWTPQRLAAATTAFVVSVYAALYFLSVIGGGDWMRRIRASNLRVAGLVVGLCVVWLSPVLNAEAISTRSQVARYLDGKTPADTLAIWEMAEDWGKAGQAGFDQLKALPVDEHGDLHKVIAFAEAGNSRHAYEREVGEDGRHAKATKALELLQILPEGTELTADALRLVPKYRLEDWLDVCASNDALGCVLLLGEFTAESTGQQGVLVLPGAGDKYDVVSVRMKSGALIAGKYLRHLESDDAVELSAEDVRNLLAGAYQIAPSSRKSLWIGDLEIHPEN